ncbi:MAG TPA: hypothetical protein VM012_14770 [Flavitalea sp.]|nr:hypothetical protein [Flavitalea sp.]
MKRVLITILSVLYITISSGMMVNIHRCMGEVSGIEYGAPHEHACSNCGMKEKAGCCNTESVFVKTTDQAKSGVTEIPSLLFHSDLPVRILTHIIFTDRISFASTEKSNSPPFSNKHPRNILYCHFRI